MDIQKSNYEYPKFSMIFGYPKIILDILNSFLYIKNELWISYDILMNSREIIQITELFMYFLQFQSENSWTLSSNLFKMIDFMK